MDSSETPLTNLQSAFCREYVVDHNGGQSAIRAGYAPKGADVRGCELLRIRKITVEIDRLEAEKAEKHDFTIQAYQKQLDEDRKLAIKLNQPSAAVSASVAKGRSMGFDKDNDIVSEQQRELTDAEQSEVDEYLAWKRSQDRDKGIKAASA